MSAMATYSKITDALIQRLEAGVIPWKQDWKNGGSFPRNLISKRMYHGSNWLLLSSLGQPSPYWVTFAQALELGGNVRKGEHSTPIIFADTILIDTESGTTVKTAQIRAGAIPESSVKIPLLKYFSVFNLSQCDNIPEKKIPKLTPEELRPAVASAEEIVFNYSATRNGCAVVTNETLNEKGHLRAFYRIDTDTVSVPPSSLFASRESHYATLFHEMVHSTGHSSRLARNTGHPFGSPEYTREELTAEIGAAYLCAHCGIESETVDNSAAYIASWIGSLKEDPTLFVQCASAARKAVEFILGGQFENLD